MKLLYCANCDKKTLHEPVAYKPVDGKIWPIYVCQVCKRGPNDT